MSRRKNHRGSEWRKWDLHIHAPGTKLYDQFKTDDGSDVWDAYCQKLHDSDVQAFGIADYFSIDCYLSVCEQYRSRYPDSRKVLFPNIELRMSYRVNKDHEEVHIHLLFNPFRPDHKEKINRFLIILKTNKTNDSGLNITVSELKNKKCYESATTTREFVQKALLETYGKNANLLDYVLIITAVNNNGMRPDDKPRNISISCELDKFSDSFFGNAGNVAWFLKTDRAGDKREPTKPKPVLSCCDAHSLADLDNKLGQVVTWIKADLTWEGLKQIIFEPENRVFIGEEPDIERRVREHKTRYIESLHITCVDGYKQQHGAWFHDEKIVFGKELVAIIGNKGSGKSAVTDIIGLLGNSRNQTCKCQSSQKPEELFSFLSKNKFLKGDLAKNFQGTLNWHGGEPDCKLLMKRLQNIFLRKLNIFHRDIWSVSVRISRIMSFGQHSMKLSFAMSKSKIGTARRISMT